ncbi:hypothetical protein C8F04DRAFT_1123753 [Mycena alexandri]|uniref:Extracellular membrane protein CFEM domain-containing protein n=1 Tax=Mycena alexandri TaxID=1745969 RepID=A0AAD6SHC7_9AGAR|nr:hypothetical protein C8F04DRAFT_1123753 [Mycena alexandri]
MLVSVVHAFNFLGLINILLTMAEASQTTGRLLLRQSSTSSFDPSQIPPQCQSACNSVVDNANTCTTYQCLCTPKNDAAVLSCVNCVTSFNSSGSTIIDGQDILNQFASECNLNNVSVSSLSASGVATVTGFSTSNLDPSPSSTGTSSANSQTASATSPPLPTSSTSAPPASSSPSSALGLPSLLWPSYAVLVIVGIALTVG